MATRAELKNIFVDGAVLDQTDMHALIDSLAHASEDGLATDAEITAALAALVDSAPGTLNTLNELAAAINDDANAYATLVGLIGAKQDALVSGTNIKTINSGSLLGDGDLALITESQRDVANGFVGVSADGSVPGMFETYSDTEANLKLQVIPNKVLVYATDTKCYFRGDGATLGGIFERSIPRFYGNGLNSADPFTPTEVTSNSTATVLETVLMPANSSWRIKGNAHFEGDTDSISNFVLRFARDGAGGWAPWIDPTLSTGGLKHTYYADYAWTHATGGSTVQGTSAPGIVKSYSNAATCSLTPFDLTKPSGLLTFDFVYGRGVSSNLLVQAILRTAKVGTPTITVNYGFSLERIK